MLFLQNNYMNYCQQHYFEMFFWNVFWNVFLKCFFEMFFWNVFLKFFFEMFLLILLFMKFFGPVQVFRFFKNDQKIHYYHISAYITVFDFWYCKRYWSYLLLYQKSSTWVVCRRRYGHFWIIRKLQLDPSFLNFFLLILVFMEFLRK